jgi:hypothetical protein
MEADLLLKSSVKGTVGTFSQPSASDCFLNILLKLPENSSYVQEVNNLLVSKSFKLQID